MLWLFCYNKGSKLTRGRKKEYGGSAMTRAQQLKRLMYIWDNARSKQGMRTGKYGQPRQQYLTVFLAEDLPEQELYQAMENFLTDSWWSNEGKKYQDLEHFVRNYSRFLPDSEEPDGIYKIERE